MAAERGLSFEEVCRLANIDSSWDLSLDRRQVELAAAGNCVLGSRLAIWLLKAADLKVFLDAPAAVRAGRIWEREKDEKKESLEATLARTNERDRRDRERYLKLYGLDHDSFGFADLVIDTSCCDQHGVADLIIEAARLKFKKIE
jgi:cytidylate kinase